VIAKRFNRAGWQIDSAGKRAKCPECRTPVREDKPTVKEQSGAASSATINAYKLIEKHFDVGLGRYATGFSDAVIANETGISKVIIAKIRKENFGNLRTNPEIVAARQEANAALENLKSEMQEIREMQDACLAEAHKVIGNLTIRLDAIEKSQGD